MSDFLPKGWIEKFEGDDASKVYYNPETEQIFRKKEDFDRYINYFTTKATHLHGTEPLWKGTTEEKDPKGKAVLTNMLEQEEEEEQLGSIYVPKETCMKFQSSTSKETLSKTYEEEDSGSDDDEDDDDDDDDDDYNPRKKYKRPSKQKGKEIESAQKTNENDDDLLPKTTTPKRRQNNWPSRKRNGCASSSGKAH